LIDCGSFAVDRNGARSSKEVFRLKGETAEAGVARHPHCAGGTPQALEGKISLETLVTAAIDGRKRRGMSRTRQADPP
jgi:hypothetical protein